MNSRLLRTIILTASFVLLSMSAFGNVGTTLSLIMLQASIVGFLTGLSTAVPVKFRGSSAAQAAKLASSSRVERRLERHIAAPHLYQIRKRHSRPAVSRTPRRVSDR